MIEARKVDIRDTSVNTNVLELISSNIITIGDTKTTKKISILNHSILSGDTAIFIDGNNEVLLINTRIKEIRIF